MLRPARKTEPDSGLHLSGIRQRIESIFWTLETTSAWKHTGQRRLALAVVAA